MKIGYLFELRGPLSKKEDFFWTVIGTMLMFFAWHMITVIFNISPGILPSPLKVIAAFPELHFKDALVRNTLYSLKLNLLGVSLAFVTALPLGFIIGLIPLMRGLSEKQIAVFRYIPITLLAGVFIKQFGFYDSMKINFLGFGIFVYLLPTVVQRVSDVNEIYVQTIKTLGANKWQTFHMVFLPDVLSSVFDDLIVLAPISWTYIIIAEMLNSTGGLGSLSYLAGLQSRTDKAFAILLVIIIIGIIMDRIFKLLDKLLFPHKYATKKKG